MGANDGAGMLNGQPVKNQADKVPTEETYDTPGAEPRAAPFNKCKHHL